MVGTREAQRVPAVLGQRDSGRRRTGVLVIWALGGLIIGYSVLGMWSFGPIGILVAIVLLTAASLFSPKRVLPGLLLAGLTAGGLLLLLSITALRTEPYNDMFWTVGAVTTLVSATGMATFVLIKVLIHRSAQRRALTRS